MKPKAEQETLATQRAAHVIVWSLGCTSQIRLIVSVFSIKIGVNDLDHISKFRQNITRPEGLSESFLRKYVR